MSFILSFSKNLSSKGKGFFSYYSENYILFSSNKLFLQ